MALKFSEKGSGNVSDISTIKRRLLGMKLVDIEEGFEDLRLTFEGGLSLFITGDYAKNVYADLKRRVVTYEEVNE